MVSALEQMAYQLKTQPCKRFYALRKRTPKPVWPHQVGDGFPAIQSAGDREGQGGMATTGVHGAQSEAHGASVFTKGPHPGRERAQRPAVETPMTSPICTDRAITAAADEQEHHAHRYRD